MHIYPCKLRKNMLFKQFIDQNPVLIKMLRPMIHSVQIIHCSLLSKWPIRAEIYEQWGTSAHTEQPKCIKQEYINLVCKATAKLVPQISKFFY